MQTRGLVSVATALLLLAGCTGAPSTPAPTGAATPSASAVTDLVDGDHLNPDGVTALRARYTTLTPADQERELAELDLDVERQLWTLSGLEAALGGSQKADEVFARSNTAIRAALAESGSTVTAQVRIGRKGVVLPTDALSEANGAALFGGLMIAGLSADSAASMVDGKTKGSATEKGMTRKVTETTGSVELHTTKVIDGVELTIDTVATVQPCPDASGRVVASITASASTHQGGTGMRYSYHTDVVIQVGDDAEVASHTEDFRSEQSEYSPTGRRFVDVAVRADGTSTVKRGVGNVTDDFVTQTAISGILMGTMLGAMASRGAEAKWKSGDCVNLKPTVSAGPRGVRPGATVTIVAAPRAKSDGAKTGGSVTAELAEGKASVAPAGTKVPADATFTYVAPSAPEETGTVALESRSKRGVGKASVRFDTYPLSFAAEGGGGEFHGTGVICDLREPFTISGSGLKLSFTPTDAGAGSYKLSGNAGGVSWSGNGSYTVALNDSANSGKLATKGVNTISTPRGTFSDEAVATFTLRAIAGCR